MSISFAGMDNSIRHQKLIASETISSIAGFTAHRLYA
jgi:hypothetical protein